MVSGCGVCVSGYGWFDLSSEAPPAAVHREFFGSDGAFRAGPELPEFDRLYAEMAAQIDGAKLVAVAEWWFDSGLCHDAGCCILPGAVDTHTGHEHPTNGANKPIGCAAWTRPSPVYWKGCAAPRLPLEKVLSHVPD
jgi:hypothetical protein